MSMYNSIEYSYNYSKTSRNLWQYYRDELPLANATVVDFPDANNNSALFNFKQKIPMVKQDLIIQKILKC